MTKAMSRFSLWLLLLLAPLSQGQGFLSGLISDGNDYLPPEQAFIPEVETSEDGRSLVLHWDIAEGYYLYREQFEVEVLEGEEVRLGEPLFPAGQPHSDEFFGDQEVYYDEVGVALPVAGEPGAPLTLQLRYQGCADAGLCYPPQFAQMALTLPAQVDATLPVLASPSPSTASSSAGVASASADTFVSEQDRLAGFISGGNMAWVMLAFGGFGLLLAFTPCVLPMVPILSSIIVGQKNIGMRRAFVLSLVYVLAMALTYTVAGVIAGLLGANLQVALQNPVVLGAFALVFVLLAFAMFGFYELQVPLALQQRLGMLSDRQRGGTLGGVAVMGLLSALIVGPCVAAPLAGALMVIGQSGDPWRGGLALFALSIGMGIPLIALGMGFGTLMPRAGAWMNAIKSVFGVLLLAVALYLLDRVLPDSVIVALWALLAIGTAVYLGAFAVPVSGWQKAWKGLGLFVFSWGVLLLIGLAGGRADLINPLQGLTGSGSGQEEQHLAFKQIKTVEELDREVTLAAAEGRPVMLDFYADWCISCKEMERYTFTDASVQQALSHTLLLQADVTANDEQDQALLDRFSLYGPPGIVFFNSSGEELRNRLVIGFMGAEDFAAHVNGAIGPPTGNQG